MIRTRISLAIAFFLSGCTLGPDYHGPPAPGPLPSGSFVRAPADAAQAVPGATWWRVLDDPVLDGLVADALAANPDLDAAGARLLQSRAALRSVRADAAPIGSGSIAYSHAEAPGVAGAAAAAGSGTDLFEAQFDASWEIDIFGGQRRGREAAAADAGRAAAAVDDLRLSLAAEVVQNYAALRSVQRRIELGGRSAALLGYMLGLVRQRRDRGASSDLDVARLAAELETLRADNIRLDAERDARLDALAVLTGQAPGALDDRLVGPGGIPLPPAGLAVCDPAALLRQRPDIRGAERALAAATARIGVAEAARFPRITLLGTIGIGGADASDLTDLDNFSAVAAPQLSWRFLDFDRSAAGVDKARAVRDEAEANYRSAVLAALRDAEDSLARFRAGRIAVATLARGKIQADKASDLAALRYKAGTASLTDYLDAQRKAISSEQALTAALASLTSDYAAIAKAVGLGAEAS